MMTTTGTNTTTGTATNMPDPHRRHSREGGNPESSRAALAALDSRLRGNDGVEGELANASLFNLLSWMSPAWPIGAFAHSGGLEWAVEAGHVTDRTSTAAWIADLLTLGPAHNDAVLFTYAWRAAATGDAAALAEITDLAAATQTGHERRVEATAQGAAFRRIAIGTGEDGAFATLLADVPDEALTYAVAAACQFAFHHVPLAPALTAFLHGVVANLVSAAQRLVPLGQTDGQIVLRDLRPAVLAEVERALALPEDGDPFAAMGGCTLLAELGCMAHETQYTRLFRT